MSERSKWGESLRLGQYVDALDTARVWCEAVVIATKKNKVHVHYRGWGSLYNEWVARQSQRLAPAYTHVANWRAGLKKGDRVQVGTNHKGRKTPLWRGARVNQVRRPQGASSEPAQVQVKLCEDGEMRWMSPQDELLRQAQEHEGEGEGDTETDSTTAAPLKETEEEELPVWQAALTKGSLAEVKDAQGKHWYEARVVGRRVKQVCVRYRGWPFKYDEWIELAGGRIAQPHTHFRKWRDFKKGDRVQVGFRETPNSDTASHWEEGTVVSCTVGKQTKRLQRVKIRLDCESAEGESNGDSSKKQCVWRDVQDDYLAPIGVPTFPFQPGLFDSDDASGSAAWEDASSCDILDLGAPHSDSNERQTSASAGESKGPPGENSQRSRVTQVKVKIAQVFARALQEALDLVDVAMDQEEERSGVQAVRSWPDEATPDKSYI